MASFFRRELAKRFLSPSLSVLPVVFLRRGALSLTRRASLDEASPVWLMLRWRDMACLLCRLTGCISNSVGSLWWCLWPLPFFSSLSMVNDGSPLPLRSSGWYCLIWS